MARVLDQRGTKEGEQGNLEDQLLTPEEVADHLRVSRPTVYAWLKMGRLRGLRAGRVWRIRRADLDAFLQPAPAAESTDASRRYSREEVLQFLAEDQMDEETRTRIASLLAP